MKTISLLSLTLLVGISSAGCVYETDDLVGTTVGGNLSPDTLAKMILAHDVEGMHEVISAGVDPNMAGSTSLPPLHLTAMLGFIEEGRALIERGARIDKTCVVPGPGAAPDDTTWTPVTTPLHLAAQMGHVDYVLMLLDQDKQLVDVNIQNAHGGTPLDTARAVLDQLTRREGLLNTSIETNKKEATGRAEPLDRMLARTRVQREHVESVVRVLEFQGAKTSQELLAIQLHAEIDADTNRNNVAKRVRELKQERQAQGRRFISQADRLQKQAVAPVVKDNSVTKDPNDAP